MWRLAFIALVACSGESRRETEPVAPGQTAEPIREVAVIDASPPPDAFDASEALAIIAERAAQAEPKMRLTEAQAAAAASHVRRHLDRSAALRRLHGVMPHSTVELARAIEERGVVAAEADRIADYLVHLVGVLDFAKLRRFDINHSHVTGRQWHEIDYTGERMTWQGQKEYWSVRGVLSFERAEYVHAYMKQAYRMPHFARVYAPRGSFDGVQPPAGGS